MSDLFSGVPVKDFVTAKKWYEQLLGCAADFFPNNEEAVWKLAEHQYIYIVQMPEHAGHAILMHMVDDLDIFISEITKRGINYSQREYFPNDVCKITYTDPDGNQVSFGGIENGSSKNT
ncbi:VOC family protein [Reinekea forsetii]|nr:VOC family protein [Reinekea forsetii]